MPMWARAIIFGIELVGFAIFCVFGLNKFYAQEKVSNKTSEELRSNFRFDIIYFVINYGVILSLFLFSYSSFVFLSYSKLICLSVFILISCVTIIIIIFQKPKKRDNRATIFGGTIIFLIFFFVFAITGILDIENKVDIYEQTKTEIITPSIISENQVGYTADMEGNIKTYVFYYQGNNGVWKYEEVKASDTKVEKIKDADTYIEKTVTTSSYCKQEKKASELDYICSEENEKYTIYLNLKQMVEIKTD